MKVKDQRDPRGRIEPDIERTSFLSIPLAWSPTEGGQGWTHGHLFSRPELPRRPKAARS